MANMSYCRFQNTVQDLEDCEDALSEVDAGTLSLEEEDAARRLIRSCERIVRDYGEEEG